MPFSSLLHPSRRFAVAIGILVILALAAFAAYRFFAVAIVPEVIGGSFDLENRVIPANAAFVEFAFSTPLDPASVSSASVAVSPVLTGSVSAHGSLVRYAFSEPLSVGDVYAFTIAAGIRSDRGTASTAPRTIELRVVSPARTIGIIPAERLTDVSKNVVAMFSVPMVPLGSIDSREDLPCPIAIVPAVPGRCVWTSSTVVEFEADRGFDYASKYHVTVASASGMLYPLSEEKSANFSTPELSFSASEDFDPAKGIVITSNAPVDPEVLRAKTVIRTLAKNVRGATANTSKPDDFVTFPVRISDVDSSHKRFSVFPETGSFLYDTGYNVQIADGLMPERGNVALAIAYDQAFRSMPVIEEMYSVLPVTVTNSDTREKTTEKNSVFVSPRDGADWDQRTIHPQPDSTLLVKARRTTAKLSLRFSKSAADGSSSPVPIDAKEIPYLQYLHESDQEYQASELDAGMKNGSKSAKETIDAAESEYRFLRIRHTKPLDPGAQYSLEFTGDAYALGLRSGAVPKVLDFSAADYTTACLTVSEPLRSRTVLDYVDNGNLTGSLVSASGSSEAKLYEVSQWWTDHPCIKNLTDEQKNAGVTRYAIDMKPLPETEYSFRLSGIASSYGVPFPDYASKSFHTGKTPEAAKLVEFGNWNGYQTMPADVPFNIGVQTRNTDSFVVEACRLPLDAGLVGSLDAPAYRKYCKGDKRVTRTTKNEFWKTTHNVLDIEKDVLGEKAGLYTFVFVGTPAEFAALDDPANADRPLALRQSVYMRSDLALAYEGSGEKDAEILWLSRLDGSPVAQGAQFRFFENSPGEPGVVREISGMSAVPVSGVPGAYSIVSGAAARPAIAGVIATVGDQSAGVNLSLDSFGNSDFDAFSWNTVTATRFVFFHTDRPLYRPGDTVYFRGIARFFDPKSGYRPYGDSKTLSVQYQNPNGESTVAMESNVDIHGNFSGSFVVPSDAKLGRYQLITPMGNDAENFEAKTQGEFFVEEYKKPLFKTLVETTAPDALYGDRVSVSAHGEYYFGGILKGAKYQYDVLSQRAFVDHGTYNDYSFGENAGWYDGDGSYEDSMEYSDTGRVGDDGVMRADFNYPVPTPSDGSGAVNAPEVRAYTHRVSLVDPVSDQAVSASATQIVYPTDVSVGIKSGAYFVEAGKPVSLRGIVLDHDSKPVAGKSVMVELVRNEWKRVKKQGVDGVDYYDYSQVDTVEASQKLVSDANGAFLREFSPKSAGSYRLRAVYSGAGGLSSVASQWLYADGPGMVYWNDGNSSVSDFLSDKREYRPGETAMLRFKAPIATGSLFVTVEKDDRILSSSVVSVTGSLVAVPVAIKPEYLPNVYVKALFVGRADAAGLPTVARGLANLAVLTGDKKLSVTVSTDKRFYAPQDPVTISVRVADSSGKPVAGAVGSLAMVDESLLALVGNPTLDPYSFFYRLERYLGVSTASSLANLIKKLEIPDSSDGAKGGGGMTGESRRLRGEFRDTAHWTAEYVTDASGNARIQVPHLPDNLTDWRVETVADAGDRVGVGYVTASTRKSVMLASNLPNFLAEADSIVLKPVISNRTSEARDFKVTLSSAAFASGSTLVRSVRVGPGEDAPVELPVRVRSMRELAGASSVDVSMEMVDASDATMRDGETVTLPIVASTMPEVTTTFGSVIGGVGYDERISLTSAEKDGILRVNYAPSAFSYLKSGFGFLSAYPYGCAEQITSSILPHVSEKRLSDAIGIPLDLKVHTIESYDRLQQASIRTTVDSALRNYLSSIRSYQSPDGGIRYWKESPQDGSSYWLTSYVLDGLFEIQSIGYEPDADMVSRMTAYLASEFDADMARLAAIPPQTTPDMAHGPKYGLNDHFAAVRALARADIRSGSRESAGRFTTLIEQSEKRSGPMEKRSLLEREEFLDTLLVVSETPHLPASEKKALLGRARAMVETIFSDSLVVNTRGAFLSEKADDSKYARLDRTMRFVGLASHSDLLADRADIREILPRMLRFAASQADPDGSYGTTMLTADTMRTFADYLASSGELADVNMAVKVLANGKSVSEKTIDASNKLSVQSASIDLATLPDATDIRFERSGSGNLVYDLSLERRVSMRDAEAKSYGFQVERSYYDAAEYDRVRAAKSAEWARYERGEIDSDALAYPDDVTKYLTPVDRIPVSGLVYARYRILVPEARDYVAFEAPIPAGTMLVNPRLSADAGGKTPLSNPMFSYEEYRLDRYFGFAQSLSAGEYEVTFSLRATHRGEFFVPVARAFQFYEPESFGRTKGGTLTVE
jgi:hypothetical protein